MDVVGFGAINLDRFILVDRIAPLERGYIRMSEDHPGGAASNTIVGLSRLEVETGLLGVLGEDRDGETLREHLAKEGVNIEGLVRKSGKSGHALCLVDKDGNHTAYVEPGVNDSVSLGDIDLGLLEETRLLHLTSFMCKESTKPFEAQQELARMVDADISFDPGFAYASLGLDAISEIIGISRIVFLSEFELRMLTSKDIEKGCGSILDLGAEIVAITRGQDGCFVSDGKERLFLSALGCEVIDSTGAGDAFAAGFIYALMKGKPLKSCGHLGNRVASYIIQKIGCQTGLPTLEALSRQEMSEKNRARGT